MKKIRHSSLRLQQGNTDKVYEAEIIERASRNETRYLVNFRLGRFGAYLQEGSKTRKPVTLAEAEQLYNSLIVAQINKGFVVVSGDNPLADAVSATSSNLPETSQPKPVANSANNTSNLSSRQQAAFRGFMQLRSARGEQEYQRCSRQIWRLGELEMVEAVPALTEELERALALRQPDEQQLIRMYSLLWSLGRCGGSRALPLMQELTNNNERPAHIRRMALHASWHLLPQTEQQAWLTQQYRDLPESLRKLISARLETNEHPDNAEVSTRWPEQLLYWAQSHKASKPKADDHSESWFTLIYLQAKTKSALRSGLLELCRIAPMEFGSVWLIRLLFKLAEFECDAEMLGLLIPKLDGSTARSQVWGQKAYERQTYQRTTRDYFKRRGWRLLRRLGQLERDEYVSIASAVLQTYDDKDSQPQTMQRYSWEGGFHTIDYQLPAFSNHIALNQILYRHSDKYQSMAGGTCWQQISAEQETKRSEAFAALWDAQPFAFIDCLKHSRFGAVHEFALRGVKQQIAFLPTVAVSDWIQIFCCPFADSATFAQAQLERFHDAALNDVGVLAQMVRAETQTARAFAHQRLDSLTDAQLLTAIDWHVQMIISPYADNREQARTYHARYPQAGEQQQLLLVKLIAYAQGLTAETLPQPDIMRSISWSISEPLAPATRQLDFAVVTDLLEHPLIEVQRLGADILVARKDNPADLPEGIFKALLNSEDPELRAAGVKLLGNLDDAELLTRHELLASLLVSVDAPVRTQAKQIIARLTTRTAADNAQPKAQEFSQNLLAELIPHAFHAEPVEGAHEEMLQATQDDLVSVWDTVEHAQLWRLLTARSRSAQRMGSILLQPRTAQSFSVQQWARLGKHVSKDTRRWAWQAYTDNVERVRTDFTAGLRLLDTGWDDTRHFALDYFRGQFGAEDWTDEHLIFLCDSTRDDVQRLGRDLLREHFRADQGESYLLKLSQHPARNVQLFATEFLQDYAADKPAVIASLQPYFITILSAVNRGRVAKDRVLDFLLVEAAKDAQVAELLSVILERQSVTVAIQDKGKFIQAMLALSAQYPALKLPLQNIAPPLRGVDNDPKSEAA